MSGEAVQPLELEAWMRDVHEFSGGRPRRHRAGARPCTWLPGLPLAAAGLTTRLRVPAVPPAAANAFKQLAMLVVARHMQVGGRGVVVC